MPEHICLGFHSYGTCVTQFAISLAGLIRYEGSKVVSVIHVPSPYVTEARNKIVRKFLSGTKASHLLMLDVDLEFPEDALSETVQAMHASQAEIMFGCYALGDFRPSIFGNPGPEKHLPVVAIDLESSKNYEIYAGSTGWLLSSRGAMLKIEEANKDKHWPWFDHDVENADDLKTGDLYLPASNSLRLGEDFSFSKRAREAGIKLWGTTRPLLIHGKLQPLLPKFQESLAVARGIRVNNNVEQVGKNNAEQTKETPNSPSDPSSESSGSGVGEQEKRDPKG